MKCTTGVVACKLWKGTWFIPFFTLILILGIIKAVIFGPLATIIVFAGNSAITIGLWPAHFLWTYCCVTKTKRIGLTLKLLLLVSLPVPLVVWPIFGIAGSLLVGIGHGFFTPLIETFEASGDTLRDKFFHYFVDGCISTLKESCKIVQDFKDFCFHSYFSLMDELIEKAHEDDEPMDIKLLMLPGCLLVGILAIPVDVVLITSVALFKSPHMLYKGWKRLFEDLIGREGPFLEAVCVPFAGLAILLWPIAVVAGVAASFLCSFFLALYGGVIVHQESSLRSGFAYIVSVVSLYDEYTNDLLYLREGSCLPRPKYRRNCAPSTELPTDRRNSLNSEGNDSRNGRVGPYGSKLVSGGSRTLKWAIKQLRPVQVWDWLFKSCEVHGRKLLHDGLISIKDIEECIVNGKCHKLGIKLPAWCILQCLLASAKSESAGLLLSEDEEVGWVDWPKDKVLEWLIGPLLIMKEQIKGLHLNEREEARLQNLIMTYNNERPEDWDDTEFPSDDNVRRAQLQAIFRRLQGIVSSMTRVPTFRRRFKNLVKILYIEAIESGVSANRLGKSKAIKRAAKRAKAKANFDNEETLGNNADEVNNKIQDDSETLGNNPNGAHNRNRDIMETTSTKAVGSVSDIGDEPQNRAHEIVDTIGDKEDEALDGEEDKETPCNISAEAHHWTHETLGTMSKDGYEAPDRTEDASIGKDTHEALNRSGDMRDTVSNDADYRTQGNKESISDSGDEPQNRADDTIGGKAEESRYGNQGKEIPCNISDEAHNQTHETLGAISNDGYEAPDRTEDATIGKDTHEAQNRSENTMDTRSNNADEAQRIQDNLGT